MNMSDEFWQEVWRLKPANRKMACDTQELPVLYGKCRIGEDSADVSVCVAWRYPSLLLETTMLKIEYGAPLPKELWHRGI